MRIQIIIADGEEIIRAGLKYLLEKEPDMEVVAEVKDGHTAVTMARGLVPHVVLLDVKMPVLNGIEATWQILSGSPNIKIIGLSTTTDPHLVRSMIKAGARGYLRKDCAFEELAWAIRVVTSNKFYLSPGITEVVVKDYVNLCSSPDHSILSRLTAREAEVMRFTVEGKLRSQIAQLMDINVKTVDSYRKHVMGKLGIGSVAELTKFAIKEGLTSLEA